MDGRVMMTRLVIITATCDLGLNVYDYPFDKHKCPLSQGKNFNISMIVYNKFPKTKFWPLKDLDRWIILKKTWNWKFSGGRRTKVLLLTTWENFLKINGKMLEETLGS